MSKYHLIDDLIQQQQFSGVVSIRNQQDIIYERSGGYRDIPNLLPNQIDTIFGLASGAKTFIAVAILLLQEEGKLHIDDPALQYVVEDLPSIDPQITIKHLLSHTSGLPDYLDEDASLDLSHIPWSKLVKPKDYFTYFPKRELDCKPGTTFKYNNGAFILLAHIIDVLTGDVHAYVKTYLETVGITHTGFDRFDQPRPNTAIGYIFEEDNTVRSNIYELPIIGGGDGGIYSTVSDIHTFWNLLFSYQIISKESLDLMIHPHTTVSDKQYYGLGVWVRKSETKHMVDMIGQDQGVSFLSSYNVLSGETMAILSNNDKDAWKVLQIIEQD